MPRRSPFVITLTAEDRSKLEAAARKYTSSYRDVIRSKIVLYAAQGLSNDEIAQRLDTPRQIVSKWRKRFFQEGLAGLEELARQGRPGVFSPRYLGRRKGLRVWAAQRGGSSPLALQHGRDQERGRPSRPGGLPVEGHGRKSRSSRSTRSRGSYSTAGNDAAMEAACLAAPWAI